MHQLLHVFERRDRHADFADLALGHWMVRVVAHLRGQVERHRQARLATLQQVAIARVGLLGRGVAGVLAHGPQTASVRRRLDAARERIFAGVTQTLALVPIRRRQVVRRIGNLERDMRRGFEQPVALRGALERLLQRRIAPLLG